MKRRSIHVLTFLLLAALSFGQAKKLEPMRGINRSQPQPPEPPQPPGPASTPDLRASDADRDRVIDVLRAATTDGRLTADEFKEIANRVLQKAGSSPALA